MYISPSFSSQVINSPSFSLWVGVGLGREHPLSFAARVGVGLVSVAMRRAAFDARQLSFFKQYCQANQNYIINERLRASPRIASKADEPKRQAAVLIPLCNRHGKPSVLFTLRTDRVGTHKGQVSFCGGHVDRGETAVEAAVRETFEEIGFPADKVEILGQAQTVPAITATLVTPVLGFLPGDVGDFEHFRVNSSEVDRIFTRTLEELLDPARNGFETLSRNGESGSFPVFGMQDKELRIWGLTAMILRATLDRVIVPNLII